MVLSSFNIELKINVKKFREEKEIIFNSIFQSSR